jgi:BirA family transcriptional regulator, biotin operon repressor / biotin---[acetyl-CoA-carboxylase] ligase
VSSPYTNLDRPPLREHALRRAVVVPGGLWTDLRVVAETGSTNADLAAMARTGAPEGAVLVAERQTAGRGRLNRVWQSPPRAGLAVSVLLRPGEALRGARPGRPDGELRGIGPARALGWIPLLAGVALAEAVRQVAEVDAYLKWPNDLLLPGDRKCGGILAEVVAGGAVIVGIGLNVTLRPEELPRPDATSLQLAGAAVTDRDPLLRRLLRALSVWYGRWRAAGGDPEASGLREDYVLHCGTLGRRVRAELPDGAALEGVAGAVDGDGRLVISTDLGQHTVAAGDVVHLR